MLCLSYYARNRILKATNNAVHLKNILLAILFSQKRKLFMPLLLQLFIGLSVLSIMGCALSPQNVSLQPRVNVAADPIGRGRPLTLIVTDQRSQQTFGSRGGVYETALLTPRNNVSDAVYKALAERLTAGGFTITQASVNSDLSLEVIIKNIDYVVRENAALSGPLINEVSVHAVIEAVVNNRGLIRSGQYQANSARRQVGYLSAAENEFIINEVIAQVLQQLLQDRDVLSSLTQ